MHKYVPLGRPDVFYKCSGHVMELDILHVSILSIEVSLNLHKEEISIGLIFHL